jgi:hypothetical protein
VLEQRNEFVGCHACLAKDGAERSTIDRFMVGNNNLRKRLVTSKDYVASVLALELKSAFHECSYALTP